MANNLDKSISQLPDGASLIPGDKVLVARGSSNYYVDGASAATASKTAYPSAAMFPQGMWGNGAASTDINKVDHPRGLQLSVKDSQTGFQLATRPIPPSMIESFTFDARISYNGFMKPGTMIGLAVATQSTGSTGNAMFFGRSFNGSFNAPIGGLWKNGVFSTLTTANANYDKGIAAYYLRAHVIGTTVQFYGSVDGLDYALIGSQDLGAPIAHYGFVAQVAGSGTNTALVDYFESSETAATPSVIKTGEIPVQPTLAPAAAPHAYWRMNVTASWGCTLGFGYVEMRDAVTNTALSWGGTPIASENVNLAPQSFQGPTSASYQGWQAVGQTGWLGYHFAYPVRIKEIVYQQLTNGGYCSSPRNMTIEFSDDGVNWTVLRTLTDLPYAEYHTFNTTTTDSSLDACTSTANPNAKSLSAPKAGCRAAFSTRRLFDDYNGPLFQISSGAGKCDVYAGVDGTADLAGPMKVAQSIGFCYVTKWYDQSGNNNHAVPTSWAQATTNRFQYYPAIIYDGTPIVMNKLPALYFNDSPLDIPNFEFTTTPSTVIAGFEWDSLSDLHVLSNLTTQNAAVSLGISPADGTLSGVWNAGNGGYTPVPGAITGSYALNYAVAQMSMSGTTASFSMALNDTVLQAPVTVSNYPAGAVPTAFSRIGAAAYNTRPGDHYGNESTNGGRFVEILVYANGSDIDGVFAALTGKQPSSRQHPGGTLGDRGSVTIATPGLGAFTIPAYANTFTIEAFAGGGSSGESYYDGHGPTAYPGLPGQSTIVVNAQGSITTDPAQVWPSSLGGFSYIPGPEPVSGPICGATGGQGGVGWKMAIPTVAEASGSISVATGPRDAIVPGGGSPGGAYTPAPGKDSFSGGIHGYAGGYVKKVFQKSDLGAPKAGESWKYFVGAGGIVPFHLGAMSPGSNGKIIFSWS